MTNESHFQALAMKNNAVLNRKVGPKCSLKINTNKEANRT